MASGLLIPTEIFPGGGSSTSRIKKKPPPSGTVFTSAGLPGPGTPEARKGAAEVFWAAAFQRPIPSTSSPAPSPESSPRSSGVWSVFFPLFQLGRSPGFSFYPPTRRLLGVACRAPSRCQVRRSAELSAAPGLVGLPLSLPRQFVYALKV